MRSEIWVHRIAGCLQLPFEGEVLDIAAGSAMDPEGVAPREHIQYLTREGREAEADAIVCSSNFGSPD